MRVNGALVLQVADHVGEDWTEPKLQRVLDCVRVQRLDGQRTACCHRLQQRQDTTCANVVSTPCVEAHQTSCGDEHTQAPDLAEMGPAPPVHLSHTTIHPYTIRLGGVTASATQR
jgi:hypothetical protein